MWNMVNTNTNYENIYCFILVSRSRTQKETTYIKKKSDENCRISTVYFLLLIRFYFSFYFFSAAPSTIITRYQRVSEVNSFSILQFFLVCIHHLLFSFWISKTCAALDSWKSFFFFWPLLVCIFFFLLFCRRKFNGYLYCI